MNTKTNTHETHTRNKHTHNLEGKVYVPPLAGGVAKKPQKSNIVWDGADKNGGQVQVKHVSSCNKATQYTKKWITLWHRANPDEKSKQVLTISLDKFDASDSQKSVDFLKELAPGFAQVPMAREELYQLRDNFLKTLLPAATPTSESRPRQQRRLWFQKQSS